MLTIAGGILIAGAIIASLAATVVGFVLPKTKEVY